MKLKCTDHNRRVMVLEDKVIHRYNGSACDSKIVTIGGQPLAERTNLRKGHSYA